MLKIFRNRNLPYQFPRLYDALVYQIIFRWLGMSGAAQTQLVASGIQHDGRLLESPFGTGALTLDLYASRPAIQVIGLDYSLPMLLAAQRRIATKGLVNVQLVCANMNVLPFANDTFDQIVTLNGLHVVDHPETVVDELLRVAEDGAMVVGTAGVAIGNEPRGGLQKLLTRLGWIKPLDDQKLHELLGLTWSKLTATRTGAMYAFRRPKLDQATGEEIAVE